MAKYLIQGNYTVDGIKGLLKDGGSGRKEAISILARSLGGSLDALYFSSAGPAYVCLMDLPDSASAAAATTVVAGSGAVTIESCTELLNPLQFDEAAKKSPAYRAPGR